MAQDTARRLPVQARSRKRYDAILDAASSTFADTGFEAATMEGIAELAATSIGSVYQFFTNKLALFEAVADRSLERSKEAFDALFDAISDDTPWEALLDGAVDAFAALDESDPAFRATVVNFSLYGVYAERDSALTRYFAKRVGQILRARAPHLDARRAKLVALVVVQLVSTMLFVAARSATSTRAGLRDEIKTVVRRYVAPELAPPAPARSSLRRSFPKAR